MSLVRDIAKVLGMHFAMGKKTTRLDATNAYPMMTRANIQDVKNST